MRRRWWVAACVAALVACGGAAPPPLLRATASSYLLGIDQLISPDFSFDSAPHAVDASGIATTGGATPSLLASSGFAGAAAEDLFRETANLALLNGPVQIGDTVEEFASAGGAATVYRADVVHLDSVRATMAVSTGALGDAAHATVRAGGATVAGTAVTEITVEWRVDNLLDILLVRGREGAVRPDDALLLAHRQTISELGLTNPAPRTASPSPSAR